MIVALVLTGLQVASGEVTPRLEEVRLQLGTSVVRAMAEPSGPWSELQIPGGVLLHSESAAECVRGRTRTKLDAPAGATPLCADGTTAWFHPSATSLELVPVALADGKRSEPWRFDDTALGLNDAAQGEGALVNAVSGRGVLLVERIDGNVRHVVCRDAQSGELRWVKSFAIAVPEEHAEAVLLAPMGTPASRGDLRTLTLLGPVLVVAGGPTEPLVALDLKTGEERWRLERLWDFERGYVGPSMWQHHVGRFGQFALGDEAEAAEALKQRRAQFDARQIGQLAWGPFAITRDGWRTESGLLVVATTAPRDEWPDQREQAWLYEISEYGQVVSVAPLPRRPLSSACIALGDRVIVACTKGAFACLAGTRVDINSFPGSGHDAIARIAWYREFDPPRTSAWLASEPAAPAVALSSGLIVRATDGGRLQREGDHVMTFPLLVLDPITGNSRDATLSVPFDGAIGRPDTNFSSDGTTMRTWMPQAIGLTGLSIADGKLQVSLATQTAPTLVCFRLSDVLGVR
jgi:hypothetical protein